jgi:hypothetical protein
VAAITGHYNRATEWVDQVLNRVQTARFEHENKEFVFLKSKSLLDKQTLDTQYILCPIEVILHLVVYSDIYLE